jgi:predicted RNase H-like nuclease (RuvC/YqgF family)
MADISQHQIDQIISAIKVKLNSEEVFSKFEKIIEKYYESNTQLNGRVTEFQRIMVDNQKEMKELLSQMVNSSVEIQESEELQTLIKDLNEVLFGDEYKLKQQVRYLQEINLAKNIRNIGIAIWLILLIMGIFGGVETFMAVKNMVTIKEAPHAVNP